MIADLTDKRRQQLAIGILVAALSLLFSITVLPLWSANASRQEGIDLLQHRLVRLQRVVDEDASLRPRLERLKRAQINDGHYLKGGTETVAAAELQRLVKSITGRNQVNVASTQILPATGEQDFVRIALKVRLRGPLTGLIESIYDLETHETFLFLDKLVLRDATRRRSAPVTAAKPFEAELEVAAYMAGET